MKLLARAAACLGLVLGVSALACQDAPAQTFPSRIVKLVVPQAPGGTTDVLARAIAGKLAETWKQNVIVENIAGASGNIGTQHVAQAEPDGYTLLVTYEGSQAMNPHVLPTTAFDAIKDFAPVATLARAGFLLVAGPKVAVKDFAGLLALARDKPDTLTYGSAGAGSANHLIGEMLKSKAGLRIRHVPYRAIAQATNDTIGGQIDTAVVSIPSVIGQVMGGALRPLVVTSASRSALLPDVPTAAEAGVAGFDVTPWWGILAPARTDPKLVAKIAADINGLLKSDEIRGVFQKQGAEPFVTTPDQFAKLLAGDVEKWGRIVKDIGLQ